MRVSHLTPIVALLLAARVAVQRDTRGPPGLAGRVERRGEVLRLAGRRSGSLRPVATRETLAGGAGGGRVTAPGPALMSLDDYARRLSQLGRGVRPGQLHVFGLLVQAGAPRRRAWRRCSPSGSVILAGDLAVSELRARGRRRAGALADRLARLLRARRASARDRTTTTFGNLVPAARDLGASAAPASASAIRATSRGMLVAFGARVRGRVLTRPRSRRASRPASRPNASPSGPRPDRSIIGDMTSVAGPVYAVGPGRSAPGQRRVALVVLPLLLYIVMLQTFWVEATEHRPRRRHCSRPRTRSPTAISPYPAYGYPPLVPSLSSPHASCRRRSSSGRRSCCSLLVASLWVAPRARLALLRRRAFSGARRSTRFRPETSRSPCCLLTALAWRSRERHVRGGRLEPALARRHEDHLLAARRLARVDETLGAQRVVSVIVAAGVTLGLWGMLGFSGLLDYPSSLDKLETAQPARATRCARSWRTLGAPRLGRAAWYAVVLAVLAACALAGRRGDDRLSFSFAVLALRSRITDRLAATRSCCSSRRLPRSTASLARLASSRRCSGSAPARERDNVADGLVSVPRR